jgi:hypothetical protein
VESGDFKMGKTPRLKITQSGSSFWPASTPLQTLQLLRSGVIGEFEEPRKSGPI